MLFSLVAWLKVHSFLLFFMFMDKTSSPRGSAVKGSGGTGRAAGGKGGGARRLWVPGGLRAAVGFREYPPIGRAWGGRPGLPALLQDRPFDGRIRLVRTSAGTKAPSASAGRHAREGVCITFRCV